MGLELVDKNRGLGTIVFRFEIMRSREGASATYNVLDQDRTKAREVIWACRGKATNQYPKIRR